MTALPSQDDVPAPKTFADMGVDDRICAALADHGIVTPFPIQELTLPLGLSGADVIGQARTGTGKTLAFGIPLLQRVDPGRRKTTQALVVVPTRELCMQVRDDLERAAARTDVRTVAVYGGKAIDPQTEELAKGAPVVVGTPGRLLDLRRRGALDLAAVRTLVLDEADEMLDLGFLPDVEQLVRATDPARQTLLFSATMPSPVVALARRYMRKPTFLRADVEESRIAPETRQYFFACHPMDKAAVLARILQAPGRGLCVAFTRTKRMADTVAGDLRDRGIAAAPIHSDLRQEARERALARFRSGKIDVLVATEVAARGLDITDVTHVVNYDCPDDDKMYLHRIGRTGRAGAAGAAITLAVWHEQTRLEVIKKALGIDEPTHEVFSTSPILDELFGLPTQPDRPRVPSEPSPRSGSRRRTRERADTAEARTAPERKATDDDGADRGARRVRRRRRPTAGGDGPASDRPATAGPAGGDGPASEGPAGGDRGERADGPAAENGSQAPTRSRTRRRTRRGPSGRAGDDVTADAHGTPREAAEADTPEGAEPRKGRRATDGVGSPEEPPRREARPRKDDRQDQRRRGSAPRGGGRSRRSGRRPPREAPRPSPSTPRADSGELRGDGRPRLTRPLSIAHLP